MQIQASLLASGSRLSGVIEKFAKIVLIVGLGLSSATVSAQGMSAGNRCVQDICGAPKAYFDLYWDGQLGKRTPYDVKQLTHHDLIPDLNKIMDADLAGVRTALQSWDNFDKLFDPKTLSDDLKLQLAVVFASNFDWATVQGAAFVDNGQVKLDPVKIKRLRPDLSEFDAKWIADVTDITSNAPNIQMMKQLEGLSLDNMIKLMNYDAKSLPLLATDLLAHAQKLQKRFGQFVVPERQLKVLAKSAIGEKLEPFEKNLFASNLLSELRYMMIDSGSPLDLLLRSRPLPIDQIKKLMAPKIDKLRHTLNSTEVEAGRGRMIRACHNMINFYVATSPTQAQIDAFGQTIETARSGALDVIPKYLTGTKLQAAEKAIRGASFVLPPERSVAMENLRHEFQELAGEMTNRRELYKHNLPLVDQTAILSRLLVDLGDTGLKYLFRETADACGELAPASFSDAAYQSGAVLVSWHSLLFPKFGIGVIAHELGHLVSKSVNRDEDLKSPVQCMIDNHLSFYKRNSVAQGQTSEEDWADTFSIRVLNDLRAKGIPSENKQCIGMTLNWKTNSFLEEGLDLTKDSVETHSTNIYRLLRLQRETVGLPPSCQAFAPTPQKSCAQ